MKCKCEIYHKTDKGKSFSHDEIAQCPLCKAAPALLTACENAIVSLAIMSMPQIDKSVASNGDILAIMAESFRVAVKLANAGTTQKESSQDGPGGAKYPLKGD